MEYLPSYKDDLYLAHHGIKGQKWGVRRFEDTNGHLTPAGKRRYYNEDGSFTSKGKKHYNSLADKGDALREKGVSDTDMFALTPKQKVAFLLTFPVSTPVALAVDIQQRKAIQASISREKDVKMAEVRRKNDELSARMEKRHNVIKKARDDAFHEVYGPNAKIDFNKIYKEMNADMSIEDSDYYKEIEEAWRKKHGFEPLNEIAHDDLCGETYLAHHGIKGMHWGIRRYQNPDGSYTSAGKAKRNANSKNHYARNVAIGVGVASTALAIYGGVYLHNANHEYGSANIIAGPLKDNLDDFGTDRSDVKLPKGTKFQRISTEANEDYIKRGHTYVSNTLHDNLVYRNKMPSVLGQDRPYIHTLKANSEVRAPSRRVAAETYLAMYPNATHAEYKNFMTYGIREDTDKQREFVSRLKRSGYNAVIDENDAGGHGIARQPLILLHPDVTTTGTHRMSHVEKVLANI